MLHFAPVRRMRAAVFGVLALAGAIAVPAAQADGPDVGTPTVVTVGDSYISGEAGRWAGNASSESYVDALGSTAYYGNATNSGESIPGCHRSESAEAFIGGGIAGKNLACSGAKTATSPYSSGSDFKPGLDFYDDGADHIEWFQGIRTVTTAFSNYYVQESLHPDYLAQLALRSCVRQAYNGGAPRGGTCRISATGANGLGEPNMLLQ